MIITMEQIRGTKLCSRRGLCQNGCVLPDGNCEIESVSYRANCISEDNGLMAYVGMTEGTFKDRVQSHYTSFNHRAYKNDTALSKHIWDLQDNNKTYQLYWEILEKVSKYHQSQQFCNVCITEKMDPIHR